MTSVPLIAVIDDDPGMRRSIDGLVRSLGYRVEMFDSAEVFLASSDAAKVVCVISDIQMPGMGGIALAQQADARLRSRFILMSALLDETMREQASEVGVRYLLRKPFDGDTLIDCIEAVVKA